VTTYFSKRILQSIIVIILVSIIIFLVIRTLPGDPILLYLSQSQVGQYTDAQIESARIQYGLNKPLTIQYVNWVSGMLHGNFGTSIFLSQKVRALILQCLPITLHLGILSIILSCVLGIIGGLICALRRGSWLDTLVTSIANFGISVPIFWLGIMMMYFFSLDLKWLPAHGYTSPFQNFWLGTKQLIMPVICLCVGSLAGITRQTRSSMLEIIRQDYIRTAWSKGLRERMVVMRHVLKNGLIPVITLVGMYVGYILGGSVLVETVFNIPGMGRLLVQAVFNQDYQIVQSGFLLISVMVTLTNIVVDISYGWIDPRIRYG
jgi:peptide/nickel transport system permease protein